MTRFLCTGDLHLGAGADYGREPGDRLRDQEAVWARTLELAADHDVDAVLFAGDAFHRRRPTPAELIAFQRPLQAFTAEHDIEVVAIAGNHDCEAAHLPTALDVFGREVDLFVQPGVWQADRGAAVACLPWTPVSRLVAARDGGERDDLHAEAAGLLIATARGLRAQIPAGQPAVLMLHWSISGASTPTGVATDDFREVVLDAIDLSDLGFDAIVAGHIHKPQLLGGGEIVGADSGAYSGYPYFYVGSPAPVDFGEAESLHGCYLLDIEGDRFRAQFLPIESRRFVTLDLGGDADEAWSLGNAIAWAVGEPDALDGAVVRVRYTATEEQARRVDHAEIRKLLDFAGAHKVFAIQADIVREDRARVAGVDETLGPIEALMLWIAENETVDGHERELLDLTAGYLEAAAA